MNFLAHLFLSDGSDDGLLGGLLGDFVKGPLVAQQSPGIRRGILLHRHIDTFTDAHDVVHRSKARVSAERRRYAGIMVDMFYDHFLARDWTRFSDEPLADFTRRAYDLLAQHQATLPERLQRMAPYMIRGDWLGSYAQVEAIGESLDGMGRRMKRENRLDGSVEELVDNYDAFAADFHAFMPALIAFARAEQVLLSRDDNT
jgi:acyl carrier protein phosphodiesterase